MRAPVISALLILALSAAAAAPALAQGGLACGPFTAAALASPEPQPDAHFRQRLAEINSAVKSLRDRILFLGDSLTERWDPDIWQQHFAARDAINAGINGDRTEHLLWRLDHGNLDGPPPPGVVLLIGTNDLGHGREPETAAEGIRANLIRLRERLPQSRILLVALPPRSQDPQDRLRREVGAVNRLIAACGDQREVLYADIGGVLLDGQGRLTAPVSPDRLHFSALGYRKLAGQLDPLIDRLLDGH